MEKSKFNKLYHPTIVPSDLMSWCVGSLSLLLIMYPSSIWFSSPTCLFFLLVFFVCLYDLIRSLNTGWSIFMVVQSFTFGCSYCYDVVLLPLLYWFINYMFYDGWDLLDDIPLFSDNLDIYSFKLFESWFCA